jgi:hypothetical protein
MAAQLSREKERSSRVVGIRGIETTDGDGGGAMIAAQDRRG